MCSLYLSPKVLEVPPMYSLSQERSPHCNQYMTPIWLTIESLSLWETNRSLIVLLLLKWVCMPYLPQIFLILSQRPCVSVGYDNGTHGFNIIGSKLGTCDILIVSPIRTLPRRSIKPFLHLVQSPFGVFTLC